MFKIQNLQIRSTKYKKGIEKTMVCQLVLKITHACKMYFKV